MYDQTEIVDAEQERERKFRQALYFNRKRARRPIAHIINGSTIAWDSACEVGAEELEAPRVSCEDINGRRGSIHEATYTEYKRELEAIKESGISEGGYMLFVRQSHGMSTDTFIERMHVHAREERDSMHEGYLPDDEVLHLLTVRKRKREAMTIGDLIRIEELAGACA